MSRSTQHSKLLFVAWMIAHSANPSFNDTLKLEMCAPGSPLVFELTYFIRRGIDSPCTEINTGRYAGAHSMKLADYRMAWHLLLELVPLRRAHSSVKVMVSSPSTSGPGALARKFTFTFI